MSCSQTLAGIARDCASVIGGIKRVLLANKADVTTVTVTSNQVTAITMAASAKFKEYAFRRNTGSLTSEYQVSEDNDSKFVQTDLVMVFSKMETVKRIEVVALAQADLVAIVEDANGKYWFLGFDEPVYLVTGNQLTGTARADLNGYNVTLRDISKELPYEVDDSIISGLL